MVVQCHNMGLSFLGHVCNPAVADLQRGDNESSQSKSVFRPARAPLKKIIIVDPRLCVCRLTSVTRCLLPLACRLQSRQSCWLQSFAGRVFASSCGSPDGIFEKEKNFGMGRQSPNHFCVVGRATYVKEIRVKLRQEADIMAGAFLTDCAGGVAACGDNRACQNGQVRVRSPDNHGKARLLLR